MDPSSDLDLRVTAKARGGRARRYSDRAVLWMHRQADRLDLVPSEFGGETPVDREDAGAVAREWWRQLRLWAAYNPEQMFALKAGAAALGVTMVLLVVLVGALG